jgi:hypothetical protein
MQAELKFNLDESDDIQAHFRCIKALDMALCLWDLNNFIRNKDAYSESPDISIEDLRTEFNDLLEKYDLSFDNLIS